VPNFEDLATFLSASTDENLRLGQFVFPKINANGKSHVKLINILRGPLSDLELVDSNLDGLAGGVGTRSQREVSRGLIGLKVSFVIVGAEIHWLHGE
jgi:hypothetical protein